MQNHWQECGEGCGTLPSKAPLANPYVPFQEENAQTYQSAAGLVRGTLFPGLDLPFMNMSNTSELSNTMHHQLQALHFAVSELGLYLDTHPTDQEALDLFNQYAELYEDAVQKYEQEERPLMQMRAGSNDSFQWVKGPWPWEYNANKEG